ncbi:exosortase/archaeosortase family protein [uncultured Tateyamaria sp.]|uniref:exosortase/archaeosortase family protein n=1 Tax=uncultured Tateyamaria sp. TaxID=455651 RepID=UPI0026256C5F|nr:exosortase/archaeosortase family protein [uncultured Tateyamaria sp.]
MFLILLWTGLSFIVGSWARPEYSHGPLSALLFVMLVLRQVGLTEGDFCRDRPHWGAFFILVGALFLAGTAAFFSLGAWSGLAVFLVICAVAACILRRSIIARFLPAALVLLTTLPLSESAFLQLQNALQRITAIGSVQLSQFFGLPAALEYNVIDVAGVYLVVAQACSGLSYILPLLSFAATLAAVLRCDGWVKVIVVLMAAPIAIGMNVIRVTFIIFTVNLLGDHSHVEGFAHFLEGWLIFIASVAVLFGLAFGLTRLSGEKKLFADQFDLDFAPVFEGARRAWRTSTAQLFPPVIYLALAASITLSFAGRWFAPPPPTVEVQDAGNHGPWYIVRNTSSEMTFLSDEMDQTVSKVLVRDAPYGVVRYARLVRGKEFFEPTLPTQFLSDAPDWEVESLRYVSIPQETGGKVPDRVAALTIVRGFNRQLVYYWYEGRCGRYPDLTSTRIGALCIQSDHATDGKGWVRLSTPISAEPGAEETATQRLTSVLREISAVAP